MKTLFPCPACHRLLEPPVQASGSARLRCPLCQHELQAYDLVQGAKRTWLVIEDPGGEDLFCDFQGKPDHREEQQGEYQLAEESESEPKKSIEWEKFRPITHDEFQRRKKAARSPIAGLLQVVFGGLAAIPIALLILWYGFGKDIGDAGPTIARWAPWIVPKKFHPAPDLSVGWNTEPRSNENSLDPSKFDIDTEIRRPLEIDNEQNRADKQSGRFEALLETPSESPPALTDPNERSTVGRQLSSTLESWKSSAQAWRNWNDDSEEALPSRRELAQAYYQQTVSVANAISQLDLAKSSDRIWLDHCNQILREQLEHPKLCTTLEQGGRNYFAQGIKLGSPLVFVTDIVETQTEDGQTLVQLAESITIDKRIVPIIRRDRAGMKKIDLVRSMLFGIVESNGSNPQIRLTVIQAFPKHN